MPHRYFTLFYVTGYIFNTVFLVDLIFRTTFIGSSISFAEDLFLILFPTVGTVKKFEFSSSQPWLPSLLLHVQLTRRLLESLLVVRHDSSKMHVAHLLFALVYYPVLSLSINISSYPAHPYFQLLALILFFWASFHQYRCHVILAELRAHAPGVYGMPRGDWFELVSSPHYLAEMLVYLALFMASGAGVLLGVNCLYQLFNFTLICTPPTHQWYLKKFDNYPKHRKILIPFIY